MPSVPQVTTGQSLWAQVSTPGGKRRMPKGGSGGQFGADGPEAVRREKQYQMLKKVFGGRLFYSGVTNPTRILDVGFKDGLWSMSVLADHFPQAVVYGVEEDTVLFKRTFERDYGKQLLRRLIKRGASYLEEHFKYVHVERLSDAVLPFEDSFFDFAYARIPDVFLSDEGWVRLFQELKRVTKPDGWAEVLYCNFFWTDEPSELVDTMLQVQIEVCKVAQVAPTGGPKMDEYLQAAGISNTHRFPRLIGETPQEQLMLLRDLQAKDRMTRPIVVGFGLMDEAQFDRATEQFVEEGLRVGFHMPFDTVCFQPQDQDAMGSGVV